MEIFSWLWQDAVKAENSKTNVIVEKCNKLLKQKGFNYVANVKINNEYFPTRTYSNTTLESGYYDAVIVELGSAEGDNWWCVMYPPLCFVPSKTDTSNGNVVFRLKILDIIKNWKNNR